jgi:DNA-binding NarL/FixJ family response regulator
MPSRPNLRVLIADDHAMVRLALSESIATQPDMELIAEASDGQSALSLYRQFRPDVTVLDYQLPDTTGATLTAHLLKEDPQARIIILSIFQGEEDIWRAYKAGVLGYLPKSFEITQILEAVRQVGQGRTCFPPAIQAQIDRRQGRADLSHGELQVLRQLVLGRTNKEIAGTLFVSESTVKLHVQNILLKLRVIDRTQAAVMAVKEGIIHL